jgi:hypothetical protein
MKKEGLHELAYSLTLDPAEEIHGAIEQAAAKSWKELPSLDKLLEEPLQAETLDAEVQEAPVKVAGAEAGYRSDTIALPENYQQNPYSARGDDEEAEVSYQLSPAVNWMDAGAVYEQEIAEKAYARVLKQSHIEIYPTAEIAERVENHKLSLGWAMRFLLTAMKASLV